MAAEYLVVDNGGHGQGVEAVCEGFPQLDAIPPLAWRRMREGDNELRVQ